MNQKIRRPRKPGMENEIILSVIVLYLLIALTMLAVHQIQPDG